MIFARWSLLGDYRLFLGHIIKFKTSRLLLKLLFTRNFTLNSQDNIHIIRFIMLQILPGSQLFYDFCDWTKSPWIAENLARKFQTSSWDFIIFARITKLWKNWFWKETMVTKAAGTYQSLKNFEGKGKSQKFCEKQSDILNLKKGSSELRLMDCGKAICVR